MGNIKFHFQFWVVYITLIAALVSLEGSFPFTFYWMHFLLDLPAIAICAYPLTYWIYLLYGSKNIYLLGGLALLFLIIASILKLFTTYYLFYNIYLPNELAPDNLFSLEQFARNLFWVALPSALLLLFRLNKSWIFLQNERSELLRYRLEAELQMLKSQLNPHFLFNVLNNLYALALIKSEKTPNLIARLSNLFEYMLYQSNKSVVTLGEELELINTYIELQEMKYGNRLKVSVKYDKHAVNLMVAPLLLFPFVENCYKHGCSNDPINPKISIEIQTNGDRIDYFIENTKPGNTNSNSPNQKHGLGIKNTIKRLQILYPNKHSLDIKDEEFSYKVHLSLIGNPLNERKIDKNVIWDTNLALN